MFPEGVGVGLQVLVEAADAGGRRSFGVFSRRRDAVGGEPWVRHATGVLAPVAVSADASVLVGELGVWPPEGAVAVGVEGLYGELAESGLAYGPVFRGLRGVWRRGDELFAEVVLPEQAQDSAAAFGLHPALLDAALHAVGVDSAERRDPAVGGPLIPFAWSGVSLFAAGASSLRVRLGELGSDAVSLLVADGSGRPVASVDSVALRAASVEQVRAAAGERHDSLFRVEWTTVPVPEAGPSSAHSSEDWAVLRDCDLAELQATLDGGGAVPSVVVVECAPSSAAGDGGVSADAVRGAVCRVLGVVQGWLADERFADGRLVLVTRGAVEAVPGEGVVDLAGAAVRGLFRSAQSENPGRLVLVDVDADGVVARVGGGLLAVGEPELAVRDGVVWVPRLVRVPVAVDGPGAGGGSVVSFPVAGTVLVTGATGTLGGLVARHLVAEHGVRHLLL
ncbi:polyketide synthase dehydratase domain-containing protein, partial [Streptomyces anandii]|uniref:polyketide synthase dehydratase domain-containing protein n=1 Tax=Streptomyces anandii TaxID=285454 RepID=UPI0036F4C752